MASRNSYGLVEFAVYNLGLVCSSSPKLIVSTLGWRQHRKRMSQIGHCPDEDILRVEQICADDARVDRHRRYLRISSREFGRVENVGEFALGVAQLFHEERVLGGAQAVE